MDMYDYDEDNLNIVAGNCKHMKIRQRSMSGSRSEHSSGSGSGHSSGRGYERCNVIGNGHSRVIGRSWNSRSVNRSTGLSCDICAHWNGRSCSFNHFDSIYSDLCLDME